MTETTPQVNSSWEPTPTIPRDLPGVDTDQHARATRRAAMLRPRSPMLLQTVNLVRNHGRVGMTRDEIAIALCRPIQSVCRPVLDLLRDGELVETSARRKTRYGTFAVVIVHRDYRSQVTS